MAATCLPGTCTDEPGVHRIDLEDPMYRHIPVVQSVVRNAAYRFDGAVCQRMPGIGLEGIGELGRVAVYPYGLVILGVMLVLPYAHAVPRIEAYAYGKYGKNQGYDKFPLGNLYVGIADIQMTSP